MRRLLPRMLSKDAGWIRLWTTGPGLSWTREPVLFSERYGYRRPVFRLGRWRVFLLGRLTLPEGSAEVVEVVWTRDYRYEVTYTVPDPGMEFIDHRPFRERDLQALHRAIRDMEAPE